MAHATLTRNERVTVLLVFAAASTGFALYSYWARYIQQLDSAFLFESLDTIRQSGVPLSWTVASMPRMFTLWFTPPAEYCASALSVVTEPYRVFENHGYLLLYPLALISYFLPPEIIWAAMTALAHMVALLLPYLHLRSRGISILASVIFVVCIAMHPAWSFSLTGNYYVDRLYFMFMIPLLFGIHKVVQGYQPSRNQIVAGVALALLAASCSERAAVMVVGTLVFFVVFYWRELRGKALFVPMVGTLVVAGAWALVYFTQIYTPLPGAGGYFTHHIPPARIARHMLTPGGATFIAVNLSFMGWIVAFSGWRYALLVLGALFPNTIYELGGSEFTAWSMHYHQAYFCTIIFAACIGYERLLHWAGARHASAMIIPVTLVAVATFFATEFVNPSAVFDQSVRWSAFDNGIFGRLWANHVPDGGSYEQQRVRLMRALEQAIPPGYSVSAVEEAMPTLYRGRTIAYFPLGLGTSEYLVVLGTEQDGKLSALSGPTTYQEPSADAAVKQCLLERIDHAGYRVSQAFPGSGFVILKRNARG